MSDEKGDRRISPMEMEGLQPMPVRSSTKQHPIDQLWMLIKLHLEYYPKIAASIGFILLGLFFYFFVNSLRTPVSRHTLHHGEYTKIDQHYNFKAAQIDHWCLWVSLLNPR